MSNDVPPPGSNPPGSTPPPYGVGQNPSGDQPNYGGPQPPAYGPPGTPPPPGAGQQGPRNEPLALVSLTVGIVGICCSTLFVLSATAVITGYLGKKKIDESGGMLTGRGLAIAGMVLGVLGIIIGIVNWVLVATGAVDTGNFMSPTG